VRGAVPASFCLATFLATSLAACPGGDDGALDAGHETGANPNLDADLPPPPGYFKVQERGCANCHQETDTDAGTLTGQLEARPGSTAYGANLSPDSDTGLGHWTDFDVIRAIRQGLDREGRMLCPPMPQFSTMSDMEANAIVTYLRSLPAVHRVIPASKCGPDGGLDAGIPVAPDASTDASADAPADAVLDR
jgi:hypothetical protein